MSEETIKRVNELTYNIQQCKYILSSKKILGVCCITDSDCIPWVPVDLPEELNNAISSVISEYLEAYTQNLANL